MEIVTQFRAGRLAQKLKSAQDLSPEGRRQLQIDLIAFGRVVIGPVSEYLPQAGARETALEVLEGLLSNETLELYLGLLSSRQPEIASGVQQLLERGRHYNAIRLLDWLADEKAPKSRLEAILRAKATAIPTARIVDVLPGLCRDAQALLFRALEVTLDRGTAPELACLLKSDDWWIRMHTVRLLSRSADETMAGGLLAHVHDENKAVRYEAVRALHEMRFSLAVPHLVQALRDLDLKVQSAAIEALIDLGDTAAVQHLLVLLTDESEYVRRAAVEVLNEVATPAAIQDLVRVLRDDDWWVRVRAADALGALGGEKVVEAVLGLMEDDDTFVRRQAVELLNAVPSLMAVDLLIRALADEDWWVRERAIDALGAAGDARAVEPLMWLMEHEEKAAPLCARALGQLGDARALDPLARLATSESQEIRREAEVALHVLNTPADDGGPGSRGVATPPAQEPASPVPTTSGSDLPFKVQMPQSQSPSPPPQPQPQMQPAVALNFSDLPAGTVLLDRYRVIEKIGKGGFGAIYLVEDATVDEQVILKILNPQLSFDESALQRFIQELRLSRKVTHKNVIRIHDFLELGGAHAVSMEYFPSKDISQLLQRDGPLNCRRGLRIASQICSGLDAAHTEGVIHRDMKPGNVLVGDGDEAKIVDFGLASAQQQMGTKLTKSGYLIGTPEYMAPEQISGEITDHRADIYSLGILLYEMFSGVKPFTAETAVKVFFQHLEGECEPLGNLVAGIPPGVERLIAYAMSRKPDNRPANVEELRNLIDKEREALEASA